MPYVFALALIVIGGVVFMTTQRGSVQDTEITEVALEEQLPNEELITESVPVSETEISPTPETLDAEPENTQFIDGEYTTRTTYLTPRRDEYSLDVTLTLKDDVVVDASIDYGQGAENDPNAARFEAAYKTEVIGKPLSEISLSRVGGASLTTGAFNAALADIKADAQS